MNSINDLIIELSTTCKTPKGGKKMEIINKKQMLALMGEYPDGGIVFAEYTPCVATSDVMVTNGDFGATNILPSEGEIFSWDWNINEFRESVLFVVFDNNDVLQMIQTLVSGLKIQLDGYVQI